VKLSTIKSTWLAKGGFRLDCSPYLGGAIETEILLEELPVRKDSLGSVTKAIYHAGRESRQWVDEPEYGVRFLGAGQLQRADFSELPLISKSQVASTPAFIVRKSWTLITRSGTIGKMAYCRPEMDGLAVSEDVLRVVPDEQQIPPGYLYAFLSSKFGVPLITSGTYGAIIQHLEPAHITGLSVPRFGDATEQEIHILVEEAARLRSEASMNFSEALQDYHRTSGLDESDLSTDQKLTGSVLSNQLEGRLDTNFHRPYHLQALLPYRAGKVKSKTVGAFASAIIEPARFKRIEINDPSGVDFFGTGTLGDADPQPMYQIAAGTWVDPYRVHSETLLVPRSGQIYGIIGTAYQAIGRVLDAAVTEDAIRIHCPTPQVAGYLYLALRSPFGLRQLKARCFGGSIPHLDVHHIRKVSVPDIAEKEIKRLGDLAVSIAEKRTAAINAESKARDLVESQILQRHK
jgi:type I restriction enzyme S subunit